MKIMPTGIRLMWTGMWLGVLRWMQQRWPETAAKRGVTEERYWELRGLYNQKVNEYVNDPARRRRRQQRQERSTLEKAQIAVGSHFAYGFLWTCAKMVLWVVALTIIVNWGVKRFHGDYWDSTDMVWWATGDRHRVWHSELTPRIDWGTGCMYLESKSGQLTPRMVFLDGEYQHACFDIETPKGRAEAKKLMLMKWEPAWPK